MIRQIDYFMKLISERLYLRPWHHNDAKCLVEHCQDRNIGRYTSIPYPYKLKNAKEFINRSKNAFKSKEKFEFAIVLTETDKVIGSIGLINYNKRHKVAEVGYWLGRDYRKKGYMNEALYTILKFSFKKLKLNRIEFRCAVENKASKCVMRGAGAKLEGRLRKRRLLRDRKFHDEYLFALLKKEFKE